jgi:hypothetical protein
MAVRARFVCCGSILSLFVAGCGGGSGGGVTNTPPPGAPVISYGPGGANVTQFTFAAQSPVSLTPTNSGGPVANWTITPALPAGLVFDSSTGAITGALTTALAPTNVTVTAANAGGSSTVNLTLGADSALLNLGALCFANVAPISGPYARASIAITSTNVLTEDNCGLQHWVLWNYSSGQLLAQGEACPVVTCIDQGVGAPVDVALTGQIAVVPYIAAVGQAGFGFRVISVADGSVLATVVPANGLQWWRVAADGSYICGAVGNGVLTLWAPNGSVITTRNGNYSKAVAYCAPGQVQVAMGPAGTNVIETIAVPSGISSVSPAFAGTFNSWFLDGSAFFSNVGTTMWIYSPMAMQRVFQQNLPALTGLAGDGPWFWTFDGTTLNIYKVGPSATLTATYSVMGGNPAQATPSGSTIALFDTQLRIIDLSGAAPTEKDYSPPISGVYAAASASQWVLGSSDGAVLDGASLGTTPRYFGYGAVHSIAGSQSRFAVATSIGKVLIFKSSELSLETTLNFSASQLAISADASVLAVRASGSPNLSGANDDSVRTVSLPSGTVINTWPYVTSGANPYAVDLTLSSSGALLGQVLTTPSGPPMRQVTSSNGGPVLWSDSGSATPIRLSLDDTLIAASSSDGTISNIYLNDVKSTAVPGSAVGWLQNDELLAGGAIFNSAGIKQSGPALPSLSGPMQVLSATSIYDAASNAIYSLSTGAKTWSTTNDRLGPAAVAASRVVFVTDSNQLVTEPY